MAHKCAACGGSGRKFLPPKEGSTHQPNGRHIKCPTCLGSGRISDRMPVADAMADAETLRVHTARLLGGGHAWAALQHGVIAERRAWQGKTAEAASFAREAARAAFRAVPGLRA